jgi:hypothetical protein
VAGAFGLVGAGPSPVEAAASFVALDPVPLELISTFGAPTQDAEFSRTRATTFRGDTGSTTYAFLGGDTSLGAISATAATTFTVDGDGHVDAVFVFQVKAGLALGANTRMNLVSGAQAKNVFWRVNGADDLGAGINFVGTLMANGAISSSETNTVDGRLMTKIGAIGLADIDVHLVS